MLVEQFKCYEDGCLPTNVVIGGPGKLDAILSGSHKFDQTNNQTKESIVRQQVGYENVLSKQKVWAFSVRSFQPCWCL